MQSPWTNYELEVKAQPAVLVDEGAFSLFIEGWAKGGTEVFGEAAVMRHSVAGAAIRLHTESTMMSAKLFQKGENGARDEASNHPAFRLVAGWASDWMSAGEFRRLMTFRALFDGRSYALVERINSRPTALFPIPFHAVRRECDEVTGEPTYYLRLANGREEARTWRDVLEFSPFGGRSLLRDAAMAIGVGTQLEAHAAKTFRNGARPSGILKTQKRLGNDAIETIRNQFYKVTAGESQGGTPLLEEGLEFTPITMSASDAQTVELWRISIEETARALRAPLPLVGDLTRAVWKNVEQLAQIYLTFTLTPMLKAWSEALTRSLIEPADRDEFYTEFSLNELVKADLQTRMAAYRTAIESGVLTRAEARARENLPPYDGADVPLSPLHSREGQGEPLPNPNQEGADDGDE